MKRYTKAVAVITLALGLIGGSAQAGDRWWDGGTVNIGGNGDGASQGGAGTWNTTIQNWDQGAGLAHVAWVSANNDTAILGGAAGGQVTLGGTPVVGGLQFDTAGYTLSNGPLNFGTSGNIVVNADAATSFVTIGGTAGVAITKTGAGKLTISSNGGNGFLGQLTVAEGILSISRFDSLGATAATSVILGSSGKTGTLQWTPTSASGTKKFTLATGGTGVFQVVTAAATMSTSGAIDGGGSLIKSGAGTLALSAAAGNTYGGTTTVNGGVLQLSSANALPGGIGATGGTSALTLAGGAVGLGNGNFTRSLGTGGDQVQFTGSGGFAAYTADRAVNLGGASAGVTWNSGNFLPTGSALILGAATADTTVDFQNPIDLNGANRTIQVDDGPALVEGKISGTITGTGGGIVKTGNGVLALSGANTYDGGTTVNAGTLTLLKTQAKPASGTITVAASATLGLGVGGTGDFSSTDVDNLFANTMANVSMNATANVGIDTSSGNFTYASSVPSTTRGLFKFSANTLTLSGSNAFTGPTAVIGGTLQLTHGSAIGSSSALAMATGTTLALRSDTSTTFTTPGNGTTTFATIPAGSTTVTIDVNNNGSGSGNTLVMSGGVGFTAAAGTAYTSTLTITGGNGYVLRTPISIGRVDSTGQSLTLNPTSASIIVDGLRHGFAAGGSITLYLGGTNTGTNEVRGTQTDTQWLGVTKNTAATWVWSAANTATTLALGSIAISAGNFIITGSIASKGTITLSNTGTLHLNNSAALQSALTITGGNLDNTSGAPITTSTTNPTMAWNGNFTFIGSQGANSDLNLGSGAVTMNASRIVTVNSNATLTVGGVISGATFGLTKAGTGTLKLGGNSTYSGATSVSTGTLAVVTGGSCSNSAVTVADNAALGVAVTDIAKQWTCSNLTFSAGSGSKLIYAFGVTPSTALASLRINNNLIFNGMPTVEVYPANLPRSGSVPLLVVGGTAPTSSVPVLSGVRGTLSWGATDKTLYLNIPASGTLLIIR